MTLSILVTCIAADVQLQMGYALEMEMLEENPLGILTGIGLSAFGYAQEIEMLEEMPLRILTGIGLSAFLYCVI